MYLLSHHDLEPLANVPKEREGECLLVYVFEHVDNGGSTICCRPVSCDAHGL